MQRRRKLRRRSRQPQKPEPQFSIPVAEMDEVASTVGSASIGSPVEDAAHRKSRSVRRRLHQPRARTADC